MRPDARHRHRRLVASRWAKRLSWLGFRYDDKRSASGRDAYVLRGVGGRLRLGPVFLVDRARVAKGEDAGERESNAASGNPRTHP